MSGAMNKAKARQSRVHKLKYDVYRNSGRRAKNKVRKMRKVLKRQPNNKQLARRIEQMI